MKSTSKPAVTTQNTRRDQRNARIRADFFGMSDKGYRSSHILKELSGKYFLAEDTLERIVFMRGYYRADSADLSIMQMA